MCAYTAHTQKRKKEEKRDSTSNDEPLLHYFLPLLPLFIQTDISKKRKEKPSHSIPPPLIGATLLYACVVRHPRKTHTQTFNQMCVMHTHSLTVSKEEGEKKLEPDMNE